MKRALIIHYILVFLLFACFEKNAFSQADAGEDQLYVHGQAGPELGATDDPDWCFSWEPTTGLSDAHSPHPIATPTATTTYKLTVVGADFSFTSTDEMTVYVIDKFSMAVENNLTECMENRELTFTTKIEGTIPSVFTDQIEFVFHYDASDGYSHTMSEWSFNGTEDFTVFSAIDVDRNASHKYKKPYYAELKYHGASYTSDTVNIDVFELWIDYARYSEDKPWKAVVGVPFKCSGIGSSDCKNWDWNLDRTGTFAWHPTGGRKKTDFLEIPYTDLPLAKNSYFGDAFGTLIVKCEDAEGNLYSLKSTDMVPVQKVEVFFDPTLNVEGKSPTTEKPPCWFVFWKEGVVVEDMDICGYHDTLDYGAYFPSLGELRLGPLAAGINSGPEFLLDMFGNSFSMTGEGHHLKCVAETMSHELYHKYIHDAWGGVAPQSDSDGLPDAEEVSPHKPFFVVSSPFDDNTFNYGAYANTNYADSEVRCRIVEINPGIKKIYPEKDWSMDPENPKW
jgi:hypothetical protein